MDRRVPLPALAVALSVTGCAGLFGLRSAEEACQKGVARACDDAAEAATKRAPAPGTYERYCDLGGAYACYRAASELERAKGAIPETAAQLVLLPQRACHHFLQP